MITVGKPGYFSWLPVRWKHGPERDVVADVIGQLIDLGYPGSTIHPEYRLGPGCRVDVAVITPGVVLLVECKAYRVVRSDARQAERYLEAARRRWPDRNVIAVLTAPEVDRRIVERPDLIVMSTR